MDMLVEELEELKLGGSGSQDKSHWEQCIESIQAAYVPQTLVGNDRPCEEKDFAEYKSSIKTHLQNILTFLSILRRMRDKGSPLTNSGNAAVTNFRISVILLVGEQSEKSLWNCDECVSLAKEISLVLCSLFECANLSCMLTEADKQFNQTLLALRPKLLKETWKTYPAAVTCFKWLLQQVEEPFLAYHIGDVLPTALIIFDDFVPENRIIGLECIYQILQHSYLSPQLMENGYADVIYDALERLTHQREVIYVIPLYTCITSLLATMDYNNNTDKTFEWTKRDNIICTLLTKMDCESTMELRHAYILSLPQLLSNPSCAKWFEYLTRILAEYCGNHTDLKTLKATVQTAATVVSLFHVFEVRMLAHCDVLYTAFFKLHYDLTETPVFDQEIIQTLEHCIRLLYNLTPNVGDAIMRDDRMRSIMKNSLFFTSFGDTKYCN